MGWRPVAESQQKNHISYHVWARLKSSITGAVLVYCAQKSQRMFLKLYSANDIFGLICYLQCHVLVK